MSSTVLPSDKIRQEILDNEKPKKIPEDRKIDADASTNSVDPDMLTILKNRCMNNKAGNVVMAHKMLLQLQLLNGDKYLHLVKDVEYKKDPRADENGDICLYSNYTTADGIHVTGWSKYQQPTEQVTKQLTQLVALQPEDYDGIYQTYTYTLEKRHLLKLEDAICDLVIRSEKKLHYVILESQDYAVINDMVVETIVDNNTFKYEYRFIYEDNTPYMAYPEFLHKNGSCSNALYISYGYNEDSKDTNEETKPQLEYKKLILTPKVIMNFRYWFNIIPTCKKNIYHVLTSMGMCDLLFDLNVGKFKLIAEYHPNYSRVNHYWDGYSKRNLEFIKKEIDEINYREVEYESKKNCKKDVAVQCTSA